MKGIEGKNFKLILGDCIEVMKQMKASCVSTIITDPPYGLKFMGKEWDHGIPGVPFWRDPDVPPFDLCYRGCRLADT